MLPVIRQGCFFHNGFPNRVNASTIDGVIRCRSGQGREVFPISGVVRGRARSYNGLPNHHGRQGTASMNTDITIFHNPRCSKSRAALDLLREQGHQPHIVEYLKNPPSEAELAAILKLLGMELRELMRRKEEEYTQAGLDDPGLSRKQLIKALHDYPRLIERPIVLANGKAVLGRPPESVLEIL
jgi:arsenate reductase